MSFYDPLADAQSQTASALFPGPGLVHPVESVENPFLILFVYSNPCVRDDDFDKSDRVPPADPPALISFRFEADRNRPLSGVYLMPFSIKFRSSSPKAQGIPKNGDVPIGIQRLDVNLFRLSQNTDLTDHVMEDLGQMNGLLDARGIASMSVFESRRRSSTMVDIRLISSRLLLRICSYSWAALSLRRATSTSPLRMVSGVFNSCEASLLNCLICWNDLSRREIISLNVSIRREISSFTLRRFDSLVQILGGDQPGCLGDVIHRFEGLVRKELAAQAGQHQGRGHRNEQDDEESVQGILNVLQRGGDLDNS